MRASRAEGREGRGGALAWLADPSDAPRALRVARPWSEVTVGGGHLGQGGGTRRAVGRGAGGAGRPPSTASPGHLCRCPAPAAGVATRSWAAARRPPLSSPPRPQLGSALSLHKVQVQRRTPQSGFAAGLERGVPPAAPPLQAGPAWPGTRALRLWLFPAAVPGTAAAEGGAQAWPSPWRGVPSCFGSGRHSLQWERDGLWGCHRAWPSGVPMTATPVRAGPSPLGPRGVLVTWLEL